MNVIATTDGSAIASLISSIAGASDLGALRDDIRRARWALEMARLERERVWRYRGADAIEFRRALARRICRCLTNVRRAEQTLAEAEMVDALRRAQEAQQATLTTQQVQLFIKYLSDIMAWFDRRSPSASADFDAHMRLLMRDHAAWMRDLILQIATRPISITPN